MIRRTDGNGKPPLGTQINWSDPLSQGLVGCWLFNEGGGSSPIELVDNRKGTFVSTGMSLSPKGLTTVSPTATTSLNTGKIYMTTELVTVVVSNIIPASTLPEQSFVSQYQASTNSVTAQLVAGKFRVAGGTSGATVTSLMTVNAGVSYNIACTKKAAGAFELFINGKLDTIGTIAGATGKVIAVTTMIGNDATTGDAFQGSVGSIFIYNRALSASEIQRLHELTKGW